MRYHQSLIWEYEYTRNNQNVKMATKLYDQTFNVVSSKMETGNRDINTTISEGVANILVTFSTWLDAGTSISEREYIHASVNIPWDTVDTQQYVKSENFYANSELVNCGDANEHISFIPRAFINIFTSGWTQINGSFFGNAVYHTVQNVNTAYFMFKIDVRLFL